MKRLTIIGYLARPVISARIAADMRQGSRSSRARRHILAICCPCNARKIADIFEADATGAGERP
jgi:hypothetical protein